ncbi:cell adhesion molecule 1a isoform X1 [Tachysurus ichikawai]
MNSIIKSQFRSGPAWKAPETSSETLGAKSVLFLFRPDCFCTGNPAALRFRPEMSVGDCLDSRAGAGAQRAVDHAVIGGVVAVVVFAMLCLLIILGRYFARHKGTYFTHEAKGADDAADADTAIINAEGGHNNSDEKKEYYI